MTDLHARIAVRAYFTWEAAGRPDGQHEAHWLAAEAVEIADTGADHDAHYGAFLYARLGDMVEVDAINGAPERGRDMGVHHIAHVFTFHEDMRARAAKRSAAARKGAATRRANREAAAAVLAADAIGAPVRGRRPTAH